MHPSSLRERGLSERAQLARSAAAEGEGAFGCEVMSAKLVMPSLVLSLRLCRLMKGSICMKPQVDYTLYLVTDQGLMSTDTLEEAVEAACKGGVTLVQIREKHASDEEFVDVARRCKVITDSYDVGLIINDNPHVAAAIGALGVHVGQDDTPVPQVRDIVGPDAIIGVSAHSVVEALAAKEQGADYLGIGGITPTTTKPEATALSFEELDAIMAAFEGPCVAIGGVNENTIPQCKKHPFAGYAVVSAIIAQPDIEQAARELLDIIKA